MGSAFTNEKGTARTCPTGTSFRDVRIENPESRRSKYTRFFGGEGGAIPDHVLKTAVEAGAEQILSMWNARKMQPQLVPPQNPSRYVLPVEKGNRTTREKNKEAQEGRKQTSTRPQRSFQVPHTCMYGELAPVVAIRDTEL
ncbi:hypothetical protein C8J57DRAFT_1229712 [Mycena rebaudengoi]|nr:hypothetical protein C8J57DRAFT_1229712 [Mycena rebaudengoi]